MKAANVPPETPVVTLKGACRDRQAKGACEKVITRQELDRFVNASSGDPSAKARGRAAVEYARTVALSALAEQQGIDKNPVLAKELDAQLKLVRMRFLASAYMQALQRQTPVVAEAAIQQYYDGHREEFEQVQLRRVAVPFAVPTADGRPLDRSAAKAEMADLQSRAVAGEDLNRLLQDAYKNLHIQAVPPPVSVMTLRRNDVQGDEGKAFALTPGEVLQCSTCPRPLRF